MIFKKGDDVKVLRMPSGCLGRFPKEKVGSTVTISSVFPKDKLYIVNDNRWGCNFIEGDLGCPKIDNWKNIIEGD